MLHEKQVLPGVSNNKINIIKDRNNNTKKKNNNYNHKKTKLSQACWEAVPFGLFILLLFAE